MKGRGFLVAGVIGGIGVSPYCAHHFRPTYLFFDPSIDDILVSALKGEDTLRVFGLVVLLCAIAGLLVSLLLAKAMPPSDGCGKAEMSLLRTPLAAGILIPFAFAASVLVVYNHTPRVLDEVVWPEAFFKKMIFYSVFLGMASAILAGFLNEREQAFEHASFLGKLGTICCLPLAAVVGLASLAGLIGAGLLGGLAIGRCYSCPITGIWTGGSFAFVLLVTQSGIFWPAYFPFTAQGSK